MGRQSGKFAVVGDLETSLSGSSEEARMQDVMVLIARFGPKYLKLGNMSLKDEAVLLSYLSMLEKIDSLKMSELVQLGAEVAFCARRAGDAKTANLIIDCFPPYFLY